MGAWTAGWDCCFSVTMSCATLCDAMDCSMREALLSFTVSPSLLKFMSIELVMPSNHLILCLPLLLLPPSCPASVSFPMSWLFRSSSQSIGVSASVLPMNIQDWFPLGLTGLISLKSKRLSRVFLSTTVQKHQSAEELMLFGINASFFFYW